MNDLPSGPVAAIAGLWGVMNSPKRPGEEQTQYTLRLVRAQGVQEAMEALAAYERQHQVTYLAIPTAALVNVREAWEHNDDDTFVEEATRLTRDLFGGIDGHLTRIDGVLGRGD